MKKLCIATYVYGDTYQGFIPLYIYSVLTNYPDYDVRIYIDNELSDSVRKQLNRIEKLGNFKIIENYENVFPLSSKAAKIPQIQRSIRWLFYDDAFKDYESIYIGDIDIFICKEEIEIFDQHRGHCNFLRLPYSNWLRTRKLDKSIRPLNVIKIIKKFGAKETLRYYVNPKSSIQRLTGLHFVNTKTYYDKIKPLIPSFIEELERLASGESDEWNLAMFNNEMLLYELVLKAGIGVPEQTESNSEVNLTQNFNQVAFRPHHGLHLGIFRSDSISDKVVLETISSDVYRNFYSQFCYLRSNDEIFKEIESHFDKYIKDLIHRMDSYYKNIINTRKINEG